jgi:glucose/arabinose dehydrogenase
MYIDGVRVEIMDASCSAGGGSNGFTCTGPLPPLSPGLHTLQLATFVMSGDDVLESGRSAPLQVTVVGVAAPPAQATARSAAQRAPAGLAVRAQELARDLKMPVDAAVTSKGTLLVAERGGTVRMFTSDGVVTSDTGPAPADPADRPHLLSLTPDPDYERSHTMFAVHAVPRDGGATLQVVRYREVAGQLGERAVVYQTSTPTPAENASAVVRFGPDRKLYVLCGGSDRSGFLVRLNPDGTTPQDTAAPNPAIASGVQSARGLDWDPASNVLWVAGNSDTDGYLSAIQVTPPPVRASVEGRQDLGGPVGSLTFYTSEAVPALRGNALVASQDGSILRVRVDPADQTRVEDVQTLFDPKVGPLRTLTIAPDGTIYYMTDSTLSRLDVSGSGRTAPR